MLLLIFVLMSITFIMVVYTIQRSIPLLKDSIYDLNTIYALRVLTLILFVSLFLIVYLLKINLIFSSSKTSAIDDKLFSVWYGLKCHGCKQNQYLDRLEPSRLYELYAEKIDNGEIKGTQEERELLEKLLRKKEVKLA